MRQARKLLIAATAAMAVTTLVPTVAGAATRFESRNNYAIASGSIADAGKLQGLRQFRIAGTVVDTARYASTSFVYMRYYSTTQKKWLNTQLTSVGDGRSARISSSGVRYFGKAETVQITVCTSRRGWHCGNPSPGR
jgi:hypothetical protein